MAAQYGIVGPQRGDAPTPPPEEVPVSTPPPTPKAWLYPKKPADEIDAPKKPADDIDAVQKAALQYTLAVGRWDWEPADTADGTLKVQKGTRYWVEERRADGWTHIHSFDRRAKGWVPDQSLFHGESRKVRKAVFIGGSKAKIGDIVWLLGRKVSPSGDNLVCVLFEEREAWIDGAVVGEFPIDIKPQWYVKKTFEAKQPSHLDIKKGELVRAAKHKDAAPGSWQLVENHQWRTGWVPTSHLITEKPVTVLQTFNSDSKAMTGGWLPDKLLFVNQGDSVWVDSEQTMAGWTHCYQKDQDGYVPESALPPDTAPHTIKKKFSALDTNKDGTLDPDEMLSVLQRGDPSMTGTEVKMLFAGVDVNKDGRVQFHEFVDYLYSRDT